MIPEEIKQRVLDIIRRKKTSWEASKRRGWKDDYRSGRINVLEELEKEILAL